MTSSSDRELLSYRRQATVTAKNVWIVFGAITVLTMSTVGLSWLLHSKMGWSYDGAMLASLVTELVLVALLVFWNSRPRQVSLNADHTISTHAPITSEAHHDERVAGQPTTDVTDAPPPARLPTLQ